MSAKQTSLPIPTRATFLKSLQDLHQPICHRQSPFLAGADITESQEPLPVDDIKAYPTGRISSTNGVSSCRSGQRHPIAEHRLAPVYPECRARPLILIVTFIAPLSQFHNVATSNSFPGERRPSAVVRAPVWRQTQLSR